MVTEDPSEHSPKYKCQKSATAGVAPLKVNGCLLSDPKARAETLSQQFQSVFSNGKTYSRDDFDQQCKMEKKDLPELETIHISCFVTEEWVR